MVEIKPDPIESAPASESLPAATSAQRRGSLPSQRGLPPQAESIPHAETSPERKLSVGDRAGIDSEALTQSSITTPDDLAPVATAEGAEFQPIDWDETGHSPGSVAATAAATPVQLPVDPSSIWQSASSRRVSQLALVITLAGFGLIAATVGFIQFARSFTQNQGSVVALADSPPSQDDAVSPVDVTPEKEPPAADSELQPIAVEPPSDAEPDGNSIGSSVAAPDRDAMPADQPPQLPLPGSIPAPAPSGDTVAVGPAITAEIAAPDGGPNPLDDLPMGLRKFVPLLDVSTADNGAPQIFETPPTIDSVRLDAAAGDAAEETPTPKRPSIDIAKALTMRFAIDHGGATLSELMLLISQLTAVPIELELISIDLAGVSVNQPLKTPAGWLTAGQWLEQSLATAGLAYEIADDRVLVFATAQSLFAKSGSALQLDDFGDDAAEVAHWLQPIVTPQTPVADAPTDEQDPRHVNPPVVAATYDAQQRTLVVPLERFLLVQSICAVEAMRMMREMPPRLPRQQTSRWVGRWSMSKRGEAKEQEEMAGESDENGGPDGPANPPLDEASIGDWPLVGDGPSGNQVDSPRTLAGLLRRMARDNRSAVVVVWRDAMRHQVYPTDLAMPLSHGQSVGVLLDELIGEAGLQARDAGDAVWWIGSEGLYDRYEIITWIPIPPGTGDAIAGRLARAIGVNDPAQLPIAWDDSTLMIRAPRYIARQLPRFLKP